MYNFDGLWYQLKYAPPVLFFIPFLVWLFISIKKKNKKNFYISFLALIFFMVLIFINLNSILNPNIKVYEGVFVEDYSRGTARHAPFTWEYYFKGDGGAEFLYLPSGSILSFELEKGNKYRVFYEDANDIIVKIELIEDEAEQSGYGTVIDNSKD